VEYYSPVIDGSPVNPCDWFHRQANLQGQSPIGHGKPANGSNLPMMDASNL
jgi:hypothetical protein